VIASEPTTTTCGGCCTLGSDTLWPWCQTHNRRTTECIRALEEERDAIKQFAAEEIVRHSLTIRERNGLRALLEEWHDTPYFDTREGWLKWVAAYKPKIRAALDGEGKKA
jgi:hypothetical protein